MSNYPGPGSGGGGGYGANAPNPAGKGGTNAGDGGARDGENGHAAVDGFGGGGGGKGGDGVVVFVLRPVDFGAAFEDEVLATTDGTVRGVGTAAGVAYVFTNGTARLLFKSPVQIVRKLIVGGEEFAEEGVIGEFGAEDGGRGSTKGGEPLRGEILHLVTE